MATLSMGQTNLQNKNNMLAFASTCGPHYSVDSNWSKICQTCNTVGSALSCCHTAGSAADAVPSWTQKALGCTSSETIKGLNLTLRIVAVLQGHRKYFASGVVHKSNGKCNTNYRASQGVTGISMPTHLRVKMCLSHNLHTRRAWQAQASSPNALLCFTALHCAEPC